MVEVTKTPIETTMSFWTEIRERKIREPSQRDESQGCTPLYSVY
jgi:hypothetical protein